MQDAVDASINRVFYDAVPGRPRLRIGVLIDGTTASAYARAVLEDIRTCGYADLVCFVSNAEPNTGTRDTGGSAGTRALKLLADRGRWRTLAYTAYERWYVAPRSPAPSPTARVDCADLMAGAEVIQTTPRRSGFVDRFDEATLERLRALELDVVLRFGFRIIRGGILEAARHGVWSFHHGHSAQYRGGPAHFWELVERNPVSGVVLQVLSERLDAGRVIARGLYATAPSLSVAENRFGPYWSAQHFVIRSLHELHVHGRLGGAPAEADDPYAGRRPIYTRPTNLELGTWLAREGVRRAAGALRRRFSATTRSGSSAGRWKIALRPAGAPLPLRQDAEALAGFRWHESPAGRFWADPFLLERGAETWLFFEDYDESKGKGAISCARVEPGGELSTPVTALDREHHLSFPYVFEHAGETFMVPESSQAGAVKLYRATRFPDAWVEECELLPIRAVDTTVFESAGEWWLLASPRIVGGHAALTYVWRAPSLFGPWRLASHQPINDDVRAARAAGRPFVHEGVLWRPCQDCSVRYGRALAFNVVERLGDSPRERLMRTVEPRGAARLAGIHSYARTDRWEAIDGLFGSEHRRR